MHENLDPGTSLDQFVRGRLGAGLKNLERPRYHPVIPVVEMAALVHAAVEGGKPRYFK